jgi:hypothetical protein
VADVGCRIGAGHVDEVESFECHSVANVRPSANPC